MAPSSDVIVLVLGVVLASLYLFRGHLFNSSPKSHTTVTSVNKEENGNGNPRDFIEKMKAGVRHFLLPFYYILNILLQKKRLVIFYGSQTGTAEEYAIRIAKEAKSKFGLTSLVCDPEEYDFEKLDQFPEDCAVVFVMATYGEGEPTDNAVQLMQNLSEESFQFSKGEHKLDGLKYVVFGLGNKTYEHYNVISKQVDQHLTKMGATRIGNRGEGNDDKSMEEDYLEWKDGMWEAFARVMNVEEGQGGDTADFAVSEIQDTIAPEKVYRGMFHSFPTIEHSFVYIFVPGELSARALTRSKGIHDAKNPYAAPIALSRELFQNTHNRNCVHVELGIEGSGISYQHGDHVGVWPSNPDLEVERLLCALGLSEKRDTVIGIESLDPALAKVAFPVPTTYATVLRHYELLQLAAGDDIRATPTTANTTAWNIPFDTIVSSIPRLQPRYYSISSSPKLNPNSIHVTCVALKYDSACSRIPPRSVYGVGSNFLLNLKYAANGEIGSLVSQGNESLFPAYAIEGPRGAHREGSIYKAPIHVRRSTFRLPTNPKSPIIMIGPGTVSHWVVCHV